MLGVSAVSKRSNSPASDTHVPNFPVSMRPARCPNTCWGGVRFFHFAAPPSLRWIGSQVRGGSFECQVSVSRWRPARVAQLKGTREEGPHSPLLEVSQKGGHIDPILPGFHCISFGLPLLCEFATQEHEWILVAKTFLFNPRNGGPMCTETFSAKPFHPRSELWEILHRNCPGLLLGLSEVCSGRGYGVPGAFPGGPDIAVGRRETKRIIMPFIAEEHIKLMYIYIYKIYVIMNHIDAEETKISNLH